MYIQMISIHGLIRGSEVEMGRDADTGGQVRYVLELARALAEIPEVEQVDLFTRQIRDKNFSEHYAAEFEQLSPKARLVRLPCGGGKYIRKERLWPWLDDFVDAMIGLTRRQGRMPSVIHGHYADAGYVAKEVASAFAVPFIFTGHSLGRDKREYLRTQGWSDAKIDQDFNMERRISVEEDCLATADLVVTSTRHEVESQYGAYHNGTAPPFRVIPPGTSLERFFPYYDYDLNSGSIEEYFKQARVRMQDELNRFHFRQERPMVLAVCRPDQRKNIGALVQAYGEDRELQALANLAIFAGIRKSIEDMPEAEQAVLTDILLMMDRYDLYGRLAIPKRHDSEKEVPELYRLAASTRGVFVNPAFVEPFGLTLIEASAVGLPWVATNNGGPQDIAQNCESGLLVDASQPQEIAAAIKKLLTHRDLWAQLSTNGINRVREHYTWATHAQHYVDAVRPLLTAPSVQSGGRDVEATAPGRRLASLRYLVIVDIDDTLLGDDQSLYDLKVLLQANRDHLGFGVASGRHVDSIREVLRKHDIPPLDVCIASVGAEIYYGADYMPDKGWASRLRAKWRRQRLEETLAAQTFLQRQADPLTQREFKISYDLKEARDPAAVLPELREALSRTRTPHTLIFSRSVFVDVLPHRASKGKAVRYLAAKWDFPLRNIATAGDSGNDEDMLRGETAGIIVGNYAPELEALRETTSRVYFAQGCNAAGIIEGLHHYGFVWDHAAVTESSP